MVVTAKVLLIVSLSVFGGSAVPIAHVVDDARVNSLEAHQNKLLEAKMKLLEGKLARNRMTMAHQGPARFVKKESIQEQFGRKYWWQRSSSYRQRKRT